MTDWPIKWKSKWIWAGYPRGSGNPFPRPLSVPPKESWNRFCLLRKSFELDVVPESAPARVMADSRFILYVNGQEIGRGPARFMPERITWTELDLAPALAPGANVIAAQVRFYGRPVAWWRPAPPTYQLGFGSFAFESPEIGIESDESWRGMDAPYLSAGSEDLFYPPTEILDGREMPGGWNHADFDDSDWDGAKILSGGFIQADAARIPSEPFASPEFADIAPLTANPIELEVVGEGQTGSTFADPPDPIRDYKEAGDSEGIEATYDAGRITLATPWFEVSGPEGSAVDLYVGEDLRDDGRVEIKPRDYALRYVLGGTGATERAEGFESVGFRYVSTAARGGARVESVGAIERRYPRESDAYFKCDDPRMNKIWEVGARTLEVCQTDAFVDCPGREQRAWVGDSYVHSLLTFVTSSDWRLVRRHLVLCAESQRPDGFLTMSAGGDLSMGATTIPDYSLHWIRALCRYFEQTGEEETFYRLLPTAHQIVDAFERFRGPRGLLENLPSWVFVDWAMTQRSEVIGAVDALYAAALDDLSSFGGQRFSTLKVQTREAFEGLWDEGRGVYVDAADSQGPLRRVSQQTNAMAIVGGSAPPERHKRILDRILDKDRVVITPTPGDLPPGIGFRGQWEDPAKYVDFDQEESVVAAQPFFAHFLHDAVVRAGRRDLIPELCLAWWPQLERGNTTFEEYWDAPPGKSSRAHAWSATPTYDLTTHVLGFTQKTDDETRVEISPLFGDLEELAGAVHTPSGLVRIELTPGGGEIELPERVSATLRFDDCGLPNLELGPGRHRLEPVAG